MIKKTHGNYHTLGPFPLTQIVACLGRDSDRDPDKRDYLYFYVWGQKSRDY